ncbi:leukocyte elastase inhibitor-like isoform X1 [Lingula anatina]|uniref:Leukocyte elastase inhibitor-like isoform X1 n=1 Tax=Lingula anatina TaxID=7574 RepID=A0A2R2MIF5_LINAN|nr:leukocyte elastase inhibitor-like isoform X1 [Lingula anatina]|eukprot:XP_023929993.1 leukocyte elastase inhibitor-like isoform X1 [Lingula anatina]
MHPLVRSAVLLLCLLVVISHWSFDTLGQETQTQDATQPEQQLVTSNTNFALNMFQNLKAESDNIFFSPFSITTALSMVLLGAKGDTRSEMKRVMGYSNIPSIHEHYKRLLTRLTKSGNKYLLRIANRLFGRAGFDFNQKYIDDSGRYYDAPLDLQDFSQPSATTRYINNWVEQQTNNKIVDFLPNNFINPQLILILVNAIYFKGTWTSKFSVSNTRLQPFFTSNVNQETVPMMFQKQSFPYGTSALLKCKILELPYHGDASMVIFLPDQIDDLGHLERSLTSASVVDEALFTLRDQTVIVYLPKFKLSNMRLDLKPVLIQMGMSKMFSLGADLSGIGGKPGDLFVSKAIHEAFVDVNEEGTEAAAATAIGVFFTSLISVTPVFRADRPFVFLIREKSSGTVLFMGRLMNPVA